MVVRISEGLYPPRLGAVRGAPGVLHIRGEPEVLSRERLVAVVGTREPTGTGTDAAHRLTGALAAAGWVIVSGLAAGIDTVAHRSALEHGAPTVAVIGSGLDRIQPKESERLAEVIVEHGGVLVSEQPAGEPARPEHLIARDRLQSGLSVAVVVAQSDVASGTMHTVRFAAEQGRAVFCAEPGDTSAASKGSRVLLERPAGELCSLLPAWRQAARLCARLGEGPLARAIRVDDPGPFLDELAALLRGEDAD